MHLVQASSSSSNGSKRSDTERSIILSELETTRSGKDQSSELVSASILASRKLAAEQGKASSNNSSPQNSGQNNGRSGGVVAALKVLPLPPMAALLAPFNSRPAPSSITFTPNSPHTPTPALQKSPSGKSAQMAVSSGLFKGDIRQYNPDLHYHRAVRLNPANLPSTYGITHKFKRGWDGPVLSSRSTAQATHKIDSEGQLKRLPSSNHLGSVQSSNNIVEKPRSLGVILGSGRGRDGKKLAQAESQSVGNVVVTMTL